VATTWLESEVDADPSRGWGASISSQHALTPSYPHAVAMPINAVSRQSHPQGHPSHHLWLRLTLHGKSVSCAKRGGGYNKNEKSNPGSGTDG
jgi:hypothetical protein